MVYLITSLIRIITAVLSGILRLTLYLLRVFGLIIPLFYILVMFFVNLATDNAILGDPDYFRLALIGFGLSCAGAVILFLRNTLALPKQFASLKRRERDLEKAETELEALYARQREADFARQQEARREESPAPKAQAHAEPAPHRAPRFSESDFSGQAAEDPPFSQPYAPAPKPPQALPDTAFRSRTAVRPKPQHTETPSVFRVRQNPEYLIYDYGDRIELYHETKNGLVYVRTDYNKR